MCQYCEMGEVIAEHLIKQMDYLSAFTCTISAAVSLVVNATDGIDDEAEKIRVERHNLVTLITGMRKSLRDHQEARAHGYGTIN
jgi:hypothetical protein